MTTLMHAWRWFILLLHRGGQVLEQAAPKKRGRRQETTHGTWYHLGDLLAQLDEYFRILPLWSRHDPDSYAFHSRVGAAIVSRNVMWEKDPPPLSGHWKGPQGGPSLGAVHFQFGEELDEGLISVRMVAFSKMKRRIHVEVARGHLYQVTCFYSRSDKANHTFAGQFYVDVEADGAVRTLRQRQFGEQHGIPTKGWGYPWLLHSLSNTHREKLGLPPEDWGPRLFRFTTDIWESANLGAQVRVSKDGKTAMFNIGMERAPYFFKDRSTRVMVNGRRKPVFHCVRVHERHLADGRKSFVRTHFRGERSFEWEGYAVQITVPGLHHLSLTEFDLAADDRADALRIPKGAIGTGALGRILAGEMSTRRQETP